MDRKVFIVEDILEFSKEELPKYSDYKIIKWEQYIAATSVYRWMVVLEYDENKDQVLEDLIKAVNSLEMTFEKTFNTLSRALIDSLQNMKQKKDKSNNNSYKTESDDEFKQKAQESWAGQKNSFYNCDGD